MKGANYSLDEDQKLYFIYATENHSVYISSLNGDVATVNIDSTVLNISINDTIKYTLNDAVLELKLLDTDSSSATIFLKLDESQKAVSKDVLKDESSDSINMTDTKPAGLSLATTDKNNSVNNLLTGNVVDNKTSNLRVSMTMIILTIVIIAALVILIFFLRRHHVHRKKR